MCVERDSIEGVQICIAELGPHDIARYPKHSAVVAVGYFRDNQHSVKVDALTDKGLG